MKNLFARQFCESCRRHFFGKEDRQCPRCAVPLIGEAFHRSRKSSCENCGEMIGRAQRWTARWPLTVSAVSCCDCGKGICGQCSKLFQTKKVIGSHSRMTEGRHRISVPTFELLALCSGCSDARYLAAKEAIASRPFKCGKCEYVGRYDSFRMGRTLLQQEYAAGCPKCGLYWEPAFLGIMTDSRQLRIEATA